jgi:hypothetical protein
VAWIRTPKSFVIGLTLLVVASRRRRAAFHP